MQSFKDGDEEEDCQEKAAFGVTEAEHGGQGTGQGLQDRVYRTGTCSVDLRGKDRRAVDVEEVAAQDTGHESWEAGT